MADGSNMQDFFPRKEFVDNHIWELFYFYLPIVFMMLSVVFRVKADLMQPIFDIFHEPVSQSFLPELIPFKGLNKFLLSFLMETIWKGHYFFFDFTLLTAAFFVSSHV